MKKPKHSWNTYLIGAGAAVVLAIIIALAYGYYNYHHRNALAEWNGGRITRPDLINALKLEAGKYDPLVWRNAEQSLKIKRAILLDMVREQILFGLAEKAGVNVDEAELASELNSYKSGYTDDTFRQMLSAKGINYDDWTAKKRNKYVIQKMVKQEVIDKMDVSQAEIRAYYNKHVSKFTHPEQVRARHIVVSTMEEAQKIAQELEDGGNFAAIAKERSIAPERANEGDLGYFSRGVYPKVFDDVCFNLPVGETSQVVKSEYGYHIFKVIDKRPAGREDIEGAKDEIVANIRREKSEESFEKWFKPIYDAALVKINLNLLKQIEVTVNAEE